MTSGKKPAQVVMLPAYAAVILGIGAGAAVSLRVENDRILMSENGGPFEEILLGQNQDADRLRALLADAGTSPAVQVAPTVVADGGQSPSWPKQDDSTPSSSGNGSQPPKSGQSGNPAA
ncbi:MAG: hypothetical protein JOY67_14185 [Hyphomicrobiales bacterium]|nr:hypothetical protein [Hyphomicrobiales bacterium]MBV9113964.1 hypothetical protein [Hyphomicrobiales bacterium]MBV9519498.1 hypothetical protein [Hyphomicrobiales bacterium]